MGSESKKFAILHRVEKEHKDAVMSAIDCLLEPLSHFIEMEADMSVEDQGDDVDILIKFEIRRVR